MATVNNIFKISNPFLTAPTGVALSSDTENVVPPEKNETTGVIIEKPKTTWNFSELSGKIKNNIWLLNDEAVKANLKSKALPLAMMIGSLELLSLVADKVGMENPTLRFIFIIKGTHFIEMPFKALPPAVSAWKEAGKSFPVLKEAWTKNIKMSLAKELVPAGSGFWGKTISIASWLPCTLFHMGEGLLFSNLADALLSKKVKSAFGKYGDSAVSWMSLSFFFTREIGDFLLGSSYSAAAGGMVGNMTRFLGLGPVKSVILPLAYINGAAFLMDSLKSGVAALVKGSDKASADSLVAYVADNGNTSPVAEAYKTILGKTFTAHLSSGEALGAVVDQLQEAEVFFGLIDEKDTCKAMREEVLSDYALATSKVLAFNKSWFQEILAGAKMPTGKDVDMPAIWKGRVDSGWFKDVDIEPFFNTGNGYLEKAELETLKTILKFPIPEAEVAREFFTDEFLDADFSKEMPEDLAIINEEMKDKFLSWLDGASAILDMRRQFFMYYFIEADIKQSAGVMSDDDIAMMDLGVKAGFVKIKGGKYWIEHDKAYYKFLGNVTTSTLLSGDKTAAKFFKYLAQTRLEQFMKAASGKCEENEGCDIGALAGDVLMLFPLIEEVNAEMFDVVSAAAFKSAMKDKDVRGALEYAADEAIKRLEKDLKSKLGSAMAMDYILQSKTFAHCEAPLFPVDEEITAEKLLAADKLPLCNATNALFLGIEYYQEGIDTASKDGSAVLKMPQWDGSYVYEQMDAEAAKFQLADIHDPEMQKFAKAFSTLALYSSFASKPADAISEKVIDWDGELVDPKTLTKWIYKMAEYHYNDLTGYGKYAPEEQAQWINNAKVLWKSSVKKLQELMAPMWVDCVVAEALNDKLDAYDLFKTMLKDPKSEKIHELVKLLAVLRKGLEDKNAAFKEYADPEYVSPYVIGEDGELSWFINVIPWMKADVISAAKAMKKNVQTELDKLEEMLQNDETLIENEDFMKAKDIFESAIWKLNKEIGK